MFQALVCSPSSTVQRLLLSLTLVWSKRDVWRDSRGFSSLSKSSALFLCNCSMPVCHHSTCFKSSSCLGELASGVTQVRPGPAPPAPGFLFFSFFFPFFFFGRCPHGRRRFAGIHPYCKRQGSLYFPFAVVLNITLTHEK